MIRTSKLQQNPKFDIGIYVKSVKNKTNIYFQEDNQRNLLQQRQDIQASAASFSHKSSKRLRQQVYSPELSGQRRSKVARNANVNSNMNSNVSPTSCLKSSSTAQKLRLNKLKHLLESESELLNGSFPLPQKSVKYLDNRNDFSNFSPDPQESFQRQNHSHLSGIIDVNKFQKGFSQNIKRETSSRLQTNEDSLTMLQKASYYEKDAP